MHIFWWKKSPKIHEIAFNNIPIRTVMVTPLYRNDTFGGFSIDLQDECIPSTNTFSQSNIFMSSNTFSDTFTQSNAFMPSNTYSNTYLQLDTFTNDTHASVSLSFTYTLIYTETLSIFVSSILNTYFISCFDSNFYFITTQFIYYHYTNVQYTYYVGYYTNLLLFSNEVAEPNSNKISQTDIIAIVCSAVLLIAIIIGIVIFLFKHQKYKKQSKDKSKIKMDEANEENVNNQIDDIKNSVYNETDQWL